MNYSDRFFYFLRSIDLRYYSISHRFLKARKEKLNKKRRDFDKQEHWDFKTGIADIFLLIYVIRIYNTNVSNIISATGRERAMKVGGTMIYVIVSEFKGYVIVNLHCRLL